MITWILLALATYLANVFAALLVYLPSEGLMGHLGSRDNSPEPSPLVARLRRSVSNHQESLFLFIPLALLAMTVPTVNQAMALMGAQIYVLARIAYIPAYAVSVFAVRSVVWTISLMGLGMMALAILGG